MRRALSSLMVLWCGAAVLAGTACTKAQPPRSFVQPNALRKSDFKGTWYYDATVVDAPPTNGSVYIGMYGELQKIKWVVSEDTLFAVRAFPFVNNQEDVQTQPNAKTGPQGNVDGTADYEGQPLAAWKITKHFDIIRDYNPTTGEETNRIIESEERPWNEREYFRVDWSKNLVNDWTGIGLDLAFSNVNVTDLSYFISDPTSPDALHVERADKNDADLGFAEKEMNYLDITNQVIVDPNEQEFVIDDQGNTMKLPTCFAFYGTEDCASQKVKMRHAFAKVAPNDTYEKRVWDGVDQNLFGFFTTELRHNWNRQYGDTYTGAKRYAERFNLFKKSCNTPGTDCEAPHRVRDPNDGTWLTTFTDADVLGSGSTVTPTGRHLSEPEAINAGLISTTDPNTGANVKIPDDKFLLVGTDGVPADQDKNWIPPAQREQRTIPYYANENMPDDIWLMSKQVIDSWNNVFKAAVSDLMGKPVDQLQDVFVWCHNPVRTGDPSACMQHLKPEYNSDGSVKLDNNGKPIYLVRQGDPRYSSIIWINEYQAGGPLGLGPAMADPETGETISSKANIYGGDLDTYAAWARDVLKLINGEIDPDNYINGVNADAWVKQNAQGVASSTPHFSQDQLKQAYEAMSFGWAHGLAAGGVDRSSPKAYRQSMIDRESRFLASGVLGNGSDTEQALLDKVHGTPLEAKLMTPELQASMGLDPRVDFSTLSSADKARYSPINSERIREIVRQNRTMMEAFGYDFEPFSYNVMQHEAVKYKGMTDDQIWKDLRDRIYLAVTLHEVGHNMGLRHNFRATFDAMNYFPTYWQQRASAAQNDHPNDKTANGQVKLYARSNPKGAYTADEVNNGELEYQYSSVMDYGAAFDSDMQGLGHYDRAAIKYGYANNVEVFTSANTQSPTQLFRLASLQVYQDAYGFPSALIPTLGWSAVNYYTFPEMMKGGTPDLEARKDVSAYEIDDRSFSLGLFANASVRGALDDSGSLLPQVPYYFCSDEFVGNLSCQRFDFGADAYEQAEDIINRYKNWYLINNFKRDRFSFSSHGGYNKYIYGRYFEMLRDQLTWYALLRADFTDQASLVGANNEQQLESFFTDDQNGWGSFTAAVSEGFKLFGEVLTAPQVGTFKGEAQPDGSTLYRQTRDDNGVPTFGDFYMGDITQGRFETTTWNFNGCGYFWGDECQTRIGYFVDKWMALQVLGESQAYFTGRDTAVDVRRYAIGYWLPYKNQLLSMYGAMLAGDYKQLAPLYQGAGESLIRPNFTTAAAPQANNAVMLDPEIGFSLQMWAGLYGMAGFTSTFDHGFVDASRVFVVGNGEAPVSDAKLNDCTLPNAICTADPSQLVANGGTKEWLVFTDPLSGKTYAARSQAPTTIAGSSTPVRLDVGARMLEHARMLWNASLASSLTPTEQQVASTRYVQYQENLDLMRSLHAALGYGPFQADQ